MTYPYSGLLLINKKVKLLIHATTGMDLRRIVQSEKANPKGYILYDSIYVRFLKWFLDIQNRLVVARKGEGEEKS